MLTSCGGDSTRKDFSKSSLQSITPKETCNYYLGDTRSEDGLQILYFSEQPISSSMKLDRNFLPTPLNLSNAFDCGTAFINLSVTLPNQEAAENYLYRYNRNNSDNINLNTLLLSTSSENVELTFKRNHIDLRIRN